MLLITWSELRIEVLHGKPFARAKQNLGDLLVPLAMSQGAQGMVQAYEGLGTSVGQ